VSAPLRLVDPETGELRVPGCESCAELAGKLAAAENDIELLQGEALRLNRLVGALRKTRDRERLQHKRRNEVEDIHADWQEITGKQNSKLTPDRFDTIVARLNNEYTREHFRLAAVGAVHANPWPKKGRAAMVEIGTYARKGSWLEQFANAGAEYEARTRHESQVRVECGS